MRQPTRTLATAAAAICVAAAPSAANAEPAQLMYAATFTSVEPSGGAPDDPDFEVVAPGVIISCSSLTGTGTLAGDPSLVPPSGTIDALTGSGCTGPGGLPMAITTFLPWDILTTSGGPTIWNGEMSGVYIHIADTFAGGTACSFDTSGSVSTSYSLNTQNLTVSGSNLTVSGVAAGTCLGQVLNGDPANMSVTLHVS